MTNEQAEQFAVAALAAAQDGTAGHALIAPNGDEVALQRNGDRWTLGATQYVNGDPIVTAIVAMVTT